MVFYLSVLTALPESESANFFKTPTPGIEISRLRLWVKLQNFFTPTPWLWGINILHRTPRGGDCFSTCLHSLVVSYKIPH